MSRLFVGNLPYSCSDRDVAELFRQAGFAVVDARVTRDLDSGRSRGHGFVELAAAEDVPLAIERLHGKPLGGRPITVSVARHAGAPGVPPARPSRPRSG